MNCAEFSELLNRYLDGELDAAQRAELAKHAKACSSCAEQLAAAEEVQTILSHMDEEIAVPLPAQAAWRKAVREEARRRKMKRLYRTVGSVAALFAVTIGTTLMLHGSPAAKNSDPAAPVAYVETDGLSVAKSVPDAPMPRTVSAPQTAYSERRILAEDAAVAHGYLTDIVAEYSGVIDHEQENENGRFVYTLVPAENLPDFISAVDHIGVPVDENASLPDSTDETVGVCVIILQA